ncbi:PadR family transcriptional regulator [Proteinivorax hydrogeniformans]|uniref:PadR family transcriptional regulator n=1 Tax=Proteinivorax hydrogeniformans TaxID=1826727 RepID=A0AAU8HW37_9FIRM
MSDKVIIDWDKEEQKIEEEYKKKMNQLKQRKKESQMVGTILAKGVLPVLVMEVVSRSPKNGNEISVEVGEITAGKWVPSTGGIYPILKKMEKKGYMVSNWDDPDKRNKKNYEITETGLTELANQRNELLSSLKQTKLIFEGIEKYIMSE